MALMLFGAGDAVAQSTWYGSVSTAWNNPTNWTPSWQIPGNIQSVPASGASIIIPSGCNYYPVVTNSQTIGTLTMNQGSGSFTVAAGTLTCGAISVSGGSSYNFTINSGATVASSGKVEMGSILTVNGILTASSIQQDNTSPGFTISAGGSVSSSGSVNVQGPFTVNGTLTSGGLILNNGGALTVNTSATVISSGIWAFNGGSYNIKGGNFSFSGGTESIPAGAYTSLILNGAGTDSLASGTSVSGNLSIASGTVVKVAAGVNIPVGNLTLNGVTQASGTWGYSGQTHNNTTYFANTTGYLTVANGPPASKLVYTTVPATGTAGTAFSVTVQSQDASGNPASPTSNTTITLSKASGGGVLSGTLTGTIPTSGNSVTISTPVYSKSDTMTLTATATAGETALTAVTSGGIVFSAGAATQLAFTSTAATTTAGVASGSITVQRQDFFGNANTTDATRLVTLASTSTGTVTFIPASLSIASGSSSATFTYTDTQAGTPTITASGSGLTSGTQQETVNQLSTSVAVSSSENPSGYKDSVSFTATLPSAATGNVIFMINSVALSTNVISSGAATSAATTLLSRGTNIITAEYVGDENYTGSTNDLFGGQVVTNHSPVANAATYGRANGTSIKISITDLLAQFTSDADGDALSLESVAGGSITNHSVIATTTNGSDVYILNPYAGGAYIMLLPTNDLSETFSYVVNDTSYPALTATNMITVTVTNAVGQMTGSISTSGGSAVTTTWAGIPGSGYAVQRSPDLSTWADIWTTNAPPAGVFSFTDTTPPQPAAYYRLRQD